MCSPEKLDDYKKEIRSILIPYQRGCYLSEFNRAYKELIGTTLPFRECGFRTANEFLYSMPDVVKITLLGRDYHLLAVADEKVKHIQKMVARQKPAKLKHPVPVRYNTAAFRSQNLPPRLAQSRKVLLDYRSIPQNVPLRESSVPDYRLPQNTPSGDSRKPQTTLTKKEPKLPHKDSAQEEVVALVQHFNDRLAVDDVLCEYKRMYDKSLSLSKYGFSTIEECLREIPQIEIIENGRVAFVRYCSEMQATVNAENKNAECMYDQQTNDNTSFNIPPPKTSPNFKSGCGNNVLTSHENVPKTLEEKLKKVAARFSDGILSSEFPKYFKEVTGHSLELYELGYRCLNDLIDDFPEIFERKPVIGSKKDFVIYSVNSLKLGVNDSSVDKLCRKRVILNLRKILEAYPEGVRVHEIIHVYSINYKDSLHVKDFGFDSLETFLSNIKNKVPLRFGSINGEKSIHLVKLSNMPTDVCQAADAFDKEAIPFDASFPDFVYKRHSFPPGYDFSKFIPAYTSSVANAGHLYIQLEIDNELAEKFTKLSIDLDTIYNSNDSEQYIMKTIHIKVGASCIAKWPADQHWYRAEIISIPSMESVQVSYVDYGTRDTIPRFLLRYAKKEFIDLPAQATRCRLAFLKPPNNASDWDIQSRSRILKLCENIPLMAKIEDKGPDGVYSILLCDTNDGKEDVYINDVLINEGLADYDVAEPEKSNDALSETVLTEAHHNLNPLLAVQGLCYLQAFGATLPSLAQTESYKHLLKLVLSCCQNPITQSTNAPMMPPGFNLVPSVMSPFANQNALFNVYPSTTSALETTSVKKQNMNAIPPPVSTTDYLHASIESDTSVPPISSEISPEENEDDDNDVFDDDDDEIFQQFCQKVSISCSLCVKKTLLGDGYKIHIIVYDAMPYASSGDVSHLIWNNKEADYLLRRLQIKDIDIPFIVVSEDGNEELFKQLLRYNVKGVQNTTGFKSSILLYPLKDVVKILNIFGHPSMTLRTRLGEEVENFNANDPHWFDSGDDVESDENDCFSGVTDDDKIERLCLFDLLNMKEGIKCKKKKILSSSSSSNSSHFDVEISKLEQLYQKVLRRIQEIGEICKDSA